MLTLGEILALSRRSAGALDAVRLSDPLRARLQAAAEAEGESPAEFVRAAVAEFARDAGPEEWSTLMSRLRDGEDPGAACLESMIARSLARLPAARAEEQHAHPG